MQAAAAAAPRRSVYTMSPARALPLLVAAAALGVVAADVVDSRVAPEDVLYELSDEQYYAMPKLFHLDEYEACLGSNGVYCLGSFELTADSPHHQLFTVMQRYSGNWVDHFNHTRLHRGLCVSSRCPPQPPPQHGDTQALYSPRPLDAWFSSCVNASTVSAYNLSARLYRLEYCRRGPPAAEPAPPLSANERGFAVVLAALLGLAALSTVLDLTLTDHAKKGLEWALAWSIPGCWRALSASPPASADTDLASFDGLRVLGMMCIIIEHVCWLNTLSYLVETRHFEQTRRAGEVILMTNSTLVVQLFFIMSSFLLAHKLLQQRRRGEHVPKIRTFVSTMINRFIRMSPSYFMVVWFAASWWQRMGDGPLWTPLVGSESDICRRKWWTQVLYLNNVVQADDKCLIQTWYLAADMQLYAFALVLTLGLWRWKHGAIYVILAIFLVSIGGLFGVAYLWHLVPTVVVHRPESIRETYHGSWSFNVLYQSPLGNLPGALGGLLLAHLHHALLDANVCLNDYKVFRWTSVWATPLAVWWVAASPYVLPAAAPPPRLAAAMLAVFERPVFVTVAVIAMLGAIHGVTSTMRSVLSWRGWVVVARLTFGALMLHMIINKSLVAGRLAPTQLDRLTGILEWFGVAFVSYLAALPLALLVELPVQRLHRALSDLWKRHPESSAARAPEKSDM